MLNRLMIAADCKMVYKAKDYHRKRLKVLEQEKYIRRVNTYYIKLDDRGTKMVKDFGYDYSFQCRKKEYFERMYYKEFILCYNLFEEKKLR